MFHVLDAFVTSQMIYKSSITRDIHSEVGPSLPSHRHRCGRKEYEQYLYPTKSIKEQVEAQKESSYTTDLQSTTIYIFKYLR